MTSPLPAITTRYVAPLDPSSPPFAVHVITLVDCYMIWVGVTDEQPASVANAPSTGTLARDWACAMPANSHGAASGAATSLFRAANADVALSIAQRLARSFRKQIFLSVDVPPALLSLGREAQLRLAVERALGDVMRVLEPSPSQPAHASISAS